MGCGRQTAAKAIATVRRTSTEPTGGAGWADVRRLLAAAPTRRDVLRGVGLLGAGAALDGTLPAAGRSQGEQATPEAVETARSSELQAFLDTAATLEALGVTLDGLARQRAAQAVLDLGDGAAVVRYLRAAQCEEEAHYYFLQSEGAVPATLEFAFPDRVFRSRSTFLRTLLELEGIEIGLYMAAAHAFAAAGDLRLVEVAYQIGVIEGQHHALIKEFLDEFPANDRAFAQWRFADAAAAAEAVAATGFLDEGAEPRYAFPGPVERFCRGVFGLVPATTETEAPEAVATPAPEPDATPES
jgi:hypothetical protein